MTYQMNETEALAEAVLLLTRKMRRLHPDAFSDVWAKLPDGAKDALTLADNRADRLRDVHGARSITWPVEPDLEWTEDE
jgi:hypothetical protein